MSIGQLTKSRCIKLHQRILFIIRWTSLCVCLFIFIITLYVFLVGMDPTFNSIVYYRLSLRNDYNDQCLYFFYMEDNSTTILQRINLYAMICLTAFSCFFPSVVSLYIYISVVFCFTLLFVSPSHSCLSRNFVKDTKY